MSAQGAVRARVEANVGRLLRLQGAGCSPDEILDLFALPARCRAQLFELNSPWFVGWEHAGLVRRHADAAGYRGPLNLWSVGDQRKFVAFVAGAHVEPVGETLADALDAAYALAMLERMGP